MQNRLNDAALLFCYRCQFELHMSFLLNCSRKYRQCSYYQSHLVADGGYFEKKQITKKCLRVTRCHHSVIIKRSLKHFVNTASMFHLCSARSAGYIGTCFLYMVWDNLVVLLLLMYMFVCQFKLVIIATVVI